VELTLAVRDLVFAYDSRWLFQGYSADAPAGITWVQGTNGSGKSTLLRLLAGALAPRHGHFELDGVRCEAGARGAPMAWRAQTFWCLSDPPPTPWLTVAECLGFIAGIYARAPALWPPRGGDAPASLDEALALQVRALGLEAALSTPLRHASLGQQRKTLLAAALALPVKLLLLDEPFNALDSASAAHLERTLEERAEQRMQVILLTSHVEPHVSVSEHWRIGSVA